MSSISKPGDPDFNLFKQALDRQASTDPNLHAINFVKFPMKQGFCEYAMSNLTPTTSKINFHFIGISKEFMIALSSFFMTEVLGKIITEAEKNAGTVVSAGENPIYRSNWDVEIFHVNSFMAKSKMDLIVSLLKRKFSS